MSSENVVFRDFTQKRRPISFGLNGVEYHCRKALSPANLQAAMVAFKGIREDGSGITADNIMEKLSEAMKIMLVQESHERFVEVLNDPEAEDPIDVGQLTDIFAWLVEQYTQRPTQALTDSSATSETVNAGTDSPAGQQLAE